MQDLRYLDIYATQCSDQGLTQLSGLTLLENLNLSRNPQLTDAGLKYLESLSSCDKIYLGGTGVTAAGIAALRKALPNCRVEWDGPDKAGGSVPAPVKKN